MQYNKVEICGVNTSKLKTLKEAEKIELEKTQLRTYKENLVADILKDNVMYTYDELMKDVKE